jgi:hypothetical protein
MNLLDLQNIKMYCKNNKVAIVIDDLKTIDLGILEK